jgi:hypothetical protein
MTRLRKLWHLAAGLAAMFIIAQFAGIVPRSAVAKPAAAAAAVAHPGKHAHECGLHSAGSKLADHTPRDDTPPDQRPDHRPDHAHGNIADQCCALHLLAGVVPLVITATPADLASSALALRPTDRSAGLGTPPPYRPPRSLAL